MVVLNQLEHLQEPVGYDIARLKYHSVETYIKLSKHSQLYIFPYTINSLGTQNVLTFKSEIRPHFVKHNPNILMLTYGGLSQCFEVFKLNLQNPFRISFPRSAPTSPPHIVTDGDLNRSYFSSLSHRRHRKLLWAN